MSDKKTNIDLERWAARRVAKDFEMPRDIDLPLYKDFSDLQKVAVEKLESEYPPGLKEEFLQAWRALHHAEKRWRSMEQAVPKIVRYKWWEGEKIEP